LIKVAEFIFSVNFVMLETKILISLENEISIILINHILLPLMLSLIFGMEK